MMLSENYKRSIKGYLRDMTLSYKKMLLSVFIIIASIPILAFVFISACELFSTSFDAYTAAGTLSVGFGTILVVFSIAAFFSCTSLRMAERFRWPINRKVIAAGNFISIVLLSIVSVSVISILLMLELIPGVLPKALFNDIIVVNALTYGNFLIGFISSLLYLILGISIAYCFGMYIFRYKLKAIIILIALQFLFLIPFMSDAFSAVVNFVAKEPSIILFSLKTIIIAIIFNLLAYIPLRRMEVKA